ncbi:MAG: DUF4097 family beta strand repeat protein [Candidatus Krumholzibacteriota bacterium]|nr:DUF4097 family beta strand repeat protein [Candidatus Krumholzibacteriota bacterium]
MFKQNNYQKLVFLAALLAVFTIGTCCQASSQYEETIIRTLKLEGAEGVYIKNASGMITVIGEKGRRDIALKAIKKVKARDEEEAKKIASMMEIEISRSGDKLKIEANYPKGGRMKKNVLSFILGKSVKMGIEMYVVIPADMDLSIVSASGNVDISDINGPVGVSAASGNVEVRNIKEGLEVSVASGMIKAVDIGRHMSLTSASGSIFARNIGGDVAIRAASGSIELFELQGDLDCSLMSGDAVVDGVGAVIFEGTSGSSRFVGVRGAVEASVASGNLDFRVNPDKDVDYRITASSGDISLRFMEILEGGFVFKAGTTSGKFNLNLPINLSQVDRNKITGVVREGKAKVILETASGNIRVEEPQE